MLQEITDKTPTINISMGCTGPQGVFFVRVFVRVLGGDGRPDVAAVSLSQQALYKATHS